MYFMDALLPCVTRIVFFERISDRKKSFFALVVGAYCSLKSTIFKTQVILAKVTEKAKTLITTKAEFIVNNANQICPSFLCK